MESVLKIEKRRTLSSSSSPGVGDKPHSTDRANEAIFRGQNIASGAIKILNGVTNMKKETKEAVIKAIHSLTKLLEEQCLTKGDSQMLTRMSHVLEGIDQRLSVVENQNNSSTYADVTKNNVINTTKNSDFPLIISGKDNSKTSNEIEGIIKRNINVRSLGIGITGFRKGTRNQVVIKTSSKEDMCTIKKEIEKSADLLAREPVKKNPLVAFKGVIKGITEEDLNTSLREQNKLITLKEELKIKFRRAHRNNLLANIVCQVTPENWRTLTNCGKIFIGYQRISVMDYSPLVQCYKCLAFGHISKYCEHPTARCAYCYENHDSRECIKKNSINNHTCTLCKESNKENTQHSAFHAGCPIRAIYEKFARDATQYC